MEKTRVRRGEPYWFVDIDGKVWDRYERNEVMDSILFSIGNYFHDKQDAEQMNKKFLAILKGADVIEMPSEEEIKMYSLLNHLSEKECQSIYETISWLKTDKIVK